MSPDTIQRIHDLLGRLPTDGLSAAKQLFWTELNYDRAAQTLSQRNWPDRAREALTEPPVLLARHDSGSGPFDVIYGRLANPVAGRAFPLSVGDERLAINQLLADHPYALFVFSDPDEHHWHLVNVRYDAQVTRRSAFRRIALGPNERLRTAAERVAMLDLTTLSPDLFGRSARRCAAAYTPGVAALVASGGT
jgi:hypothetical protein